MKSKLNLVVSFTVVIMLLVSSIMSTYAVSQSDLNEIDEQISEAEQQAEEIEASLSTELKELETLSYEIEEIETTLQKLKSELNTLLAEISELEEKLEIATEEYNEKYEDACTRVIAQYKYGNISLLDVLLNSSSLTEMLSSYYTVEQIMEADQEFLEELEEQRQQIEADRTALEEKKIAVEEEKQQVEKQNVTLTNKKNEKAKKVAELNEEDAALQEQIEDLTAERAAVEKQLQQLAASAPAGGGTYTGGTLGFPLVSYTRISSYFGSRSSPLAGGSSYHKGIDLAAPLGTSILAAESGTVIATNKSCTHNYGKSSSCGCGGGFGNYVMVNHGNGLVTVYAHCTTVYVSIGDTVTKGEVIATVGTTGASTGYHLHFGVLKNGTYVDPAPYIGL